MPKPNRFEWHLLGLILGILYFCLVNPLTAVLGIVFGRHAKTRNQWAVALAGSTLYLLVIIEILKQISADFVTVWFLFIGLFPYASLLYTLGRRFLDAVKPMNTNELLERAKVLQEKDDSRRSRRARGVNGSTIPNQIYLGNVIKGNLAQVRGIVQSRRRVYLDDKALDQHAFVTGTTGGGKTETLLRIINDVLETGKRDVFIVDGKGELEFALKVKALAEKQGIKAPIFKLGHKKRGAIYNAFNGSADAIYNRLVAICGIPQMEGNALYFADVGRDLLQLVCYPEDENGDFYPPRSFDEVRERLNLKWLRKAYKHDELELETINEEIDKGELKGLSKRIRPIQRVFKRSMGSKGFSFDDTNCAVFSIVTPSVPDMGQRFLNFFMEDLKDWLGARKPKDKPALVVIDEFSQFDNRSVNAVLELARGANVGVILATQDIGRVPEEARSSIIVNTATKLLMLTPIPEEIAKLAGTILAIESSIQHDEGDPTGAGSGRIQHKFAIEMNEVRKLKPGECFVIRFGENAKIQVKQVENLISAEDQEEEKRDLEIGRTTTSEANGAKPIPATETEIEDLIL